jgi:hypothetical protein
MAKRHPYEVRDQFRLRDVPGWVRENTLCRLGWHTRKKQRKFDGGRLPLLCRACYRITGYDR